MLAALYTGATVPMRMSSNYTPLMIKRIVIVGAGGVGGCIAALLSEAKTPVELVARGAHLRAIQDHGLTLRTPRETRVFQLPASEQPEWQPGDLAILCVKSQDTAEALELIPADVAVVCAQNGVENEALVSATHATLAMMVWMMAVHLEPGIVALFGANCPGVLDIGPISATPSLSLDIAQRLRDAGFDSVHRPDIMDWKRAKLVSNLPGILQIAGTDYDPKLSEAMIAEGKAVLAKAQLPHTEIGVFLDRMKRADQAQIDGLDRPGGSLWQSKHRNSSSEVEYLNGYIVRLGARLGVPTPVNGRLLGQTTS